MTCFIRRTVRCIDVCFQAVRYYWYCDLVGCSCDLEHSDDRCVVVADESGSFRRSDDVDDDAVD